MASALSMFSFALFFFLPGLSLLFLWQCTSTRRNLVSIVGLVVFGSLGIAEAVTGLLGTSTGTIISSAILDGISGMTTNAVLVSSIYKINQHRESSIIPDVNLAIYAVSMSLFVMCGTVLSLIRRVSSSSILGPLFFLLSATMALPLLVYMFITMAPTLESDNDPQDYTETIQIPQTPTTPKHQSHHLNLPLSSSFLSLSSNPPSPASDRPLSTTTYPAHSTPKGKRCASLNLSSPQIHSIPLNPGTDTMRIGARPATSPISSRDKKTRPRLTPLDLSRQVETTTDSTCVLFPRTSSNHRQHQLPRTECRVHSITSQSGSDSTSTALRIWSLLLVAQIATLLAESLRICMQVVLSGIANNEDFGSTQKPIGIVMTEIFQNLFAVAQAACIMCALTAYTHFFSFTAVPMEQCKPLPTSIKVDRANSPLPISPNYPLNFADDSDFSGPPTASTLRMDSFLTSFPLSQFCKDQEGENLTQLDEDVEKGLRELGLNQETDLEALDLAFPFAPTSDSSLAPRPTKMDPNRHKRRKLPSVSVHDGVDIDCTKTASLTTNRNGSESFSHPLNADKTGSSSQLIPTVVAEAEATDKLKSTVTFPTQPSIPFEDVQIPGDFGKQNSLADRSISGQQHPSLARSKKESFGSKSSRSLKYGRLPSIPSLPSLAPSFAKSRLRSFSLTGKVSRRTHSTATASMMDWGSESRHLSTASLSRSSSFCSPRPKRRALDSIEGEERYLCNLGKRQDQPESQGVTDVFNSDYPVSRMRRPDALFSDNRTLSPLPFASYISENASPTNGDFLHPARPLRPTRSSTFHIFPNFDALAGLGSLGAKIGRGLSGGRSPSPTPTRMLSTGPGVGEGMIGMRSPTPRSMGGIIEMTKAAVTGAVRSPNRLGMDLFRVQGSSRGTAEEDRINLTENEDLVGGPQTRLYEGGWKGVESTDVEDIYDVELRELRTPKRLRPTKGDRWTSPSRIPRLKKTSVLVDSPGSLKSSSSWETETTPTSIGMQTPRTPNTPRSPLHKFIRTPQYLPGASPIPSATTLPCRSSPLSTSHFGNKLSSLPPTSFSDSRVCSRKPYFGGPSELFNDDPDPFAGPELGAIVRDSQVSLLREDSDKDGSQVQTATRMSAWGNLTLPVPKEKRSPGVGLRRTVSDNRKRNAAAAFNPRVNASDVQSGSANVQADTHPESPSAYSQETSTEMHLQRDFISNGNGGSSAALEAKSERRARAIGNRDRDSHGSVSHVPVEEALLAQRLLRKLNRRAEGRKGVSEQHKRGSQVENESGSSTRVTPGAASNVAASGGGKSFLLGMAKTKFLGYGWSS
ncbi:hypothetical protein DFH05DRAFT_674808 [Lentinula detonsa]|uniref:Uncharacterized protein n=1 Tax=Lentinula detonsa TaxID=2804962 RepID=A0A9W8P945_9AGAR|nr:hypothetical protein DFH05DRAFT_674808 [Lentinula detonsa]